MAVFLTDEQALPIPAERLRRLAAFVLADRGVPEGMELSILAVDRDAIAALNAHHMGSKGPTDVLAFPIDMPGESPPGVPSLLGDVVLCPDVAAEQAVAEGTTTGAMLEMLLVHGILHLLGHDHAEAEEERVMRSLTDRLLATFRRGDPVDQARVSTGETDAEVP